MVGHHRGSWVLPRQGSNRQSPIGDKGGVASGGVPHAARLAPGARAGGWGLGAGERAWPALALALANGPLVALVSCVLVLRIASLLLAPYSLLVTNYQVLTRVV